MPAVHRALGTQGDQQVVETFGRSNGGQSQIAYPFLQSVPAFGPGGSAAAKDPDLPAGLLMKSSQVSPEEGGFGTVVKAGAGNIPLEGSPVQENQEGEAAGTLASFPFKSATG